MKLLNFCGRLSYRRRAVIAILCVGIISFYFHSKVKVESRVELTKADTGSKANVLSLRLETLKQQSVDNAAAPANSSVEYSPHHGGFDTYTLPRLMSCQEPASANLVRAKLANQDDMTVGKCQEFCERHDSLYAALYNGDTCYCMNYHGSMYLEKDSECNVSCSGDNSTFCGSWNRWLIFKIAGSDGMRGWTTWMTFGRNTKAQATLWTRYRGCVGDKFKKRQCSANLQTSLNNTSATGDMASVKKHFIGCFTHQTWQLGSLDVLSTNHSSDNVTQSSMDCIRVCQGAQTMYSVLYEKQCLCTNSLGWSRPVDTCVYGFGALVFSTKEFEFSTVVLQFEARLTKKNIALVAHYRAGSTFASAMFNENPGTLYVFEPASTFHVVWKGANLSLANEAERSKIFLERIYPLWFNCDATDLPGIFLTRYPGWGMNNKGLEFFDKCKMAVHSPSGPYKCSPFIEEKCLIAPIVMAKTTRMIHAENLRAFSQLASNIEMLHVFRDPRGTLLSRARLERWYRENQFTHLKVACWELNRLSALFDDPKKAKNLHSMHYEDLATDVISTARKIYSELGLTLSNEAIQTLRRVTGQEELKKRESAYDIVQQDPKSRINSWVESLNRTVVEEADNSEDCRQFFAAYPTYYKPVSEMNNM